MTRTVYVEYGDEDGWPTGDKVELAVPFDLLARIADQVEREPARYNQTEWTSGLYDHDVNCKTAYCIGGWAATLVDVRVDPRTGWPTADSNDRLAVDMQELTARLLNLTTRAAGALVAARWQPAKGMTVPEALRELQRVSDVREGEPLRHADVAAVSTASCRALACNCEDCAPGVS